MNRENFSCFDNSVSILGFANRLLPKPNRCRLGRQVPGYRIPHRRRRCAQHRHVERAGADPPEVLVRIDGRISFPLIGDIPPPE